MYLKITPITALQRDEIRIAKGNYVTPHTDERRIGIIEQVFYHTRLCSVYWNDHKSELIPIDEIRKVG